MKFLTKKVFALSALVLAMSACSTMPTTVNDTKAKISQGVEKTKEGLSNRIPPKAGQVLAEPNVALNESYQTGAKDKETISQKTTPSVAEVAWKEFYSDERLKTLIELGLANNKNLERAVLAINRAKAAYQIQEVGNLPSVGLSGSYTRQGNKDASSGSYSVGLGMASYELDFWGKVSSLKEQALQQYLATTAAKDAAQISLISNIAQAYVNISYVKAQLYLAESTVASRERSLYIAQKRFEAGVDSKAPSLQAQVSLDTAKLAVLTAQTNLAKAQNALQYLIGGTVPEGLLPEPAITEIVATQVMSAGLPSELLYHRPDIAQAEYELKAAGANINHARAAFFPSISLSTNVGLSSVKLSDLFKGSALGWRFVPSISLPIFDAGQRKSAYQVATIGQQDALAKYENAIQVAFREVHDVLADRATLGQQLETQYRLQDNIQQSYNIAYATFRSGLSDYLSVLDAERSLFDVQRNILQLEQQRILKQIELYEKLGGGASLEAVQITKTADEQEKAMTTAQITPANIAPTERSPLTPQQALDRRLADGIKTPIGSGLQITPVADGVPTIEGENSPSTTPAVDEDGKPITPTPIPPSLLESQKPAPTPTPATVPAVVPTPVPAVPTIKPVIKRTQYDESPIKSISEMDDTTE